MTYREALDRLNGLINYEKKDGYDYTASFKLGRMRRLCELLGDPQAGINSVHVAGSKGKGSTAAFIHAILQAAGFRTGLYTSPHLVSFTERIRIGGHLISEDDFARLFAPVAAAIGRMDDTPSFFEACTAVAYLYFCEQKVDFAVYETGLGGRLDATNIIEPLVSVITPISYEHTQILGSTLAAIACEKGGIIKENGICVSAPQEQEALEVIERLCKERSARLILVGRDILYRELAGTDRREIFSVDGMAADYERLETRLLGPHQVVNAAVAIGAAEALRLRGIPIGADAVRKGVADAQWPGRLEIVRRKPLVILDGAQNRASARALVLAVKKLFTYKKLVLVLGVSKDKDVRGILDELLPVSDRVITTRSKIAERALDPSSIQEMIGRSRDDVPVTAGTEEALAAALATAGPDDLVLVTGSLFVVGEARNILTDGKACAQQV